MIMLFLLIPIGYPIGNIVESSTDVSRFTITKIPSMSTITNTGIYVDGNWSETCATYDWCTGSGTYNDPYIIQDLVINASSEYGIFINNTMEYFRIENCTVFNYGGAGIGLHYVGNGTIINNTCKNKDNGYYGILLYYSNCNIIVNNTCVNNYANNYGSGIYLYYSDNNTVVNNICAYNDHRGIYLYCSNNNTIINNTCTNNYRYGILLEYSNCNTIINNTCADNYFGIYLHYSGYNNVTDNICTDNGYGIYLYYYSNHNILTENTCARNSDSGIYLKESNHNILRSNHCTGNRGIHYEAGIYGKSSSYNIVIGNNCTGNSGAGIHFYWDSDYNNITGNTCSMNSNDGVLLEMSSHNTVMGNNCTDNGEGIYDSGISVGGYNNTVRKNNCMNNSDSGIFLGNQGYHTVTGNNCTGNSNNGIYFHFSNYNIVTGNNCTGNDNDGMHLWASDYNIITENICARNFGYGIYLSSSDYNEIFSNSLIKNSDGCLKDFGENNNIYNNTCILILIASFSVNATDIAAGESVEFNDTTTGGKMPLVYQWNFGDSLANSTVQSPVHQFTVPGKYTVILTVTDIDGDVSVSVPVVIVVRDTIPPVLDSPDDITYKQGTTNHNITWFVTDDNPHTYTIYRNDIEITSGVWTSGIPITINVDGLLSGSYDYTIVVRDLLGNSATDTVIVTVNNNDNSGNPASIGVAFPLFAPIIAIIAMVVIVVLKRKH
ncbi:MAG: NosD domain-containing protein [Candidatus Nealsonbacteria bacterium]